MTWQESTLKSKVFFENIKHTLDGRKLDYIVVHHMEPDHSANISAFMKVYDKTVEALNDRNLSLVIEMNSEAYAKCKEKLGITVAWPPYMEDYVNPLDRTKPNGDLSLYRGY